MKHLDNVLDSNESNDYEYVLQKVRLESTLGVIFVLGLFIFMGIGIKDIFTNLFFNESLLFILAYFIAITSAMYNYLRPRFVYNFELDNTELRLHLTNFMGYKRQKNVALEDFRKYHIHDHIFTSRKTIRRSYFFKEMTDLVVLGPRMKEELIPTLKKAIAKSKSNK